MRCVMLKTTTSLRLFDPFLALTLNNPRLSNLPMLASFTTGHLGLLSLHLKASTMLQPRLYRPTASPEACLAALASSLNALSLCSTHSRPPTQASVILSRHASHASQGRANGPKDSAGRRLGAKKTASEYVIPGNIIFKQRGASSNSEFPALLIN